MSDEHLSISPSSKPEPRIGDTLMYRLRNNQRPSDPDQIWRGRILTILINIDDQAQRRHYAVAILKEGYVTDYELVYPDQIVGCVPLPEPGSGPTLLIPPSVGPGPDMRG